jgi:hypothetical protein
MKFRAITNESERKRSCLLQGVVWASARIGCGNHDDCARISCFRPGIQTRDLPIIICELLTTALHLFYGETEQKKNKIK